MAEKVKLLWKDPAIAAAWAQRNSLQLSESVSIFVDRIDKFAKANYVPSLEEVLLCRIRTTGITSQEFNVDGVEFEMYDVGGQKSERKKWYFIHKLHTHPIQISPLQPDCFLLQGELFRYGERSDVRSCSLGVRPLYVRG